MVRCVKRRDNTYAVKEGKRTLGHVEKVTQPKRTVWRIVGDVYKTNHRTRKDAVHMLMHRLAHPKTYAALDAIKTRRLELPHIGSCTDNGLYSTLLRFARVLGYRVFQNELSDREMNKDFIGELDYKNKFILIRSTLCPCLTATTLAHELIHLYMHVNGTLLRKSAEETIVEAITVALATSWGIENVGFSYDYIQRYQNGWDRFKDGKLDFIFAVVYNAFMQDFEQFVTGGDT